MRRFFIFGALTFIALLLPWGAAPARADTLNQSEKFRVNTTYDASGASSITCTLRVVGTRAYFYVDDRYWNSLTAQQRSEYLSDLQELSSQFDTVIYPRSVTLWGDVANPGVDGDPRVVILLEQLKSGSGGYFETIHNYTKERVSNSNQREMIFINAQSPTTGTARTYVAHELQHLISFQQHELTLDEDDDLWLNEGRSEYNITNVGYSIPFEGSSLQRRAQAFIRNPSDSLTEWPNTTDDYAIASMFTHYLADRFGSGMVSSTIHSTAAGAQAIDAWLAPRGTHRFGDVFTDWMMASYLNNRNIDPVYSYAQSGLNTLRVRPVRLPQTDAAHLQSSYTGTLKEWQPLWITTDVNRSGVSESEVHVRVDGIQSALWRGAVVAEYQSGSTTVSEFTPGTTDIVLPAQLSGSDLVTLSAAVTHGSTEPVMDRTVASQTVTVHMALGEVQGSVRVPVSSPPPAHGQPSDGDLIRRQGQPEVYVIWGPYRRNLASGVLALYGFQNRPVLEVSDDVFFSYKASNYIRADGTEKVYAVWPDNTKHWLNITAAQWDASRRDWGAIFIVNASEANFYATGQDIVQ